MWWRGLDGERDAYLQGPITHCKRASQTVGSSGRVHSTRRLVWEGMLIESPGSISTTRSSKASLAAPVSTKTHSCSGWSYQKPSGDRWPVLTILSILTPVPC